MALFSWASSWSTRVSGEDLVEWKEMDLMIHTTFLLENTGLDDFSPTVVDFGANHANSFIILCESEARRLCAVARLR